MEVDLTELCPHFDDGYTTKATCSKCNGSEDAVKVKVPGNATWDVDAIFNAKYDGVCGECDGRVEVGDTMAHLSDGRFVCGPCGGVE